MKRTGQKAYTVFCFCSFKIINLTKMSIYISQKRKIFVAETLF